MSDDKAKDSKENPQEKSKEKGLDKEQPEYSDQTESGYEQQRIEQNKITPKANTKMSKSDWINLSLAVFTALLFGVGAYGLKIANDTFKETKRDFEADNIPYLQCNTFLFTVFKPDSFPVLRFAETNLGKQPAKIKTVKMALMYWPYIPKDTFAVLRTIAKSPKPINVYVSKESPNVGEFTCDSVLTKYYYDLIKSKIVSIYFVGEFEYINEITKAPMIYKFIANIAMPPAPNYIMVYNENFPAPK